MGLSFSCRTVTLNFTLDHKSMTTLARSLLVAFLLLLSAPTRAIEAEEAEVTVQKEQLSGLGTLGKGIALGLEGSGKLISQHKQPNRHDKNSRDMVSTYSFLGVRTQWLRPGQIPEKVLLYSLEVKGRRHPVSGRLAVGSATTKEIASRYGEPSTRTSSTMVYFAPDYVQDTRITFHFSDGVLGAIRWDFQD
ncbi:MAG: hypothetical protein OEL88_04000 [Sterolibacteriaceae bacterium MAG5]|nr:hypothetical protein [Candidatus Nitricoxidireducens bremensis]